MKFKRLETLITETEASRDEIYRAVYFADSLQKQDIEILREIETEQGSIREEVLTLLGDNTLPEELYEFIEEKFPSDEFILPIPCDFGDLEEYFQKILLAISGTFEEYEQWLHAFFVVEDISPISMDFLGDIVLVKKESTLITKENYYKLLSLYRKKHYLSSLKTLQ